MRRGRRSCETEKKDWNHLKRSQICGIVIVTHCRYNMTASMNPDSQWSCWSQWNFSMVIDTLKSVPWFQARFWFRTSSVCFYAVSRCTSWSWPSDRIQDKAVSNAGKNSPPHLKVIVHIIPNIVRTPIFYSLAARSRKLQIVVLNISPRGIHADYADVILGALYYLLCRFS